MTVLLAARGITKGFPGVTALDGVDFEVNAGEVHTLVGENGSGKSTLMNILSGALAPEHGEISLRGDPLPLGDPAVSRAAGIGHVHQEPQVAPALTVAENIVMGTWPIRRGVVSWRAVRRRAETVLADLDIDLDPGARAGDLPIGRRQVIELARALMLGPSVVLLDEATSSLTDDDVAKLFAFVRRRRAEGAAVVFVSHRLREVAELADRATVLRDGRRIGTVEVATTTERQIVAMMVGRDLSAFWHKEAVVPGAPRLEVRGLDRGMLRGIDLTVRAGEIVGLAGLVGAGRSALMRTLIGERRPTAGQILVDGVVAPITSPARALDLGIAYVPEDRKRDGLVMGWPIRKNASLSCLRSRHPWSVVRRQFDVAAYRRGTGRMTVRAPSLEQTVGRLSGGNQQKVVVAKNLAAAPKVLLLDEPTRGIDVGAKAEIYAEMATLIGAGMALLVASSELPELLGVCDRIYVMFLGQIVAELQREQATEELIAYYSTGGHEIGATRVDTD